MSRSQRLPWQHIKRCEAAFSFQSQLLERGQARGAESRVGTGNSLLPPLELQVNHIPLPGASLPSMLLRKLGSDVSISQVSKSRVGVFCLASWLLDWVPDFKACTFVSLFGVNGPKDFRIPLAWGIHALVH